MRLLFVIIIIIICNACSNKDATNYLTERKPVFQDYLIESSDSVLLNNILDIWYWRNDENKVYVFSPRSKDGFLFVYSYPDFEFLYKYGVRGNGPGEFVSVNWGDTKNENQVVLFDIMKRELYSFNADEEKVENINHYNLYGPSSESTLSKPFTRIIQLNDSIYLMKADMPDNTYLETINLNIGSVIFSAPGLIERPEGISYSPFDYQICNSDSIIVLAYNYIDRIEFARIDTNYNIHTLKVIGKEGNFESYNINLLPECYSDLKSSGNYIFAVNQLNRPENQSAIEIYNVNGDPIKRLLTDQYIELVLISPDLKYIYGYNPNDESGYIYKYNIEI